ncbi:MAG: helix-turn-helix domain-containing protein [Novosphingobium sp.]
MNLVAIATDRNRHLAVRIKRPGERRSISRSATRALDVLEAFGTARRPLRAIEIARLLDLTPSTANQLLKTMADSAHLLFDARTKTYRPSPRLAAIACWITETYGLDSRMSDLVRDVQARTGFVATVAMQSDLFMQVIELCGGEGAGGERGLKISLFGSAIGSAFLSTLDDAEVRRLADRARVPRGELPEVLATLARIRDTGHAAGPTAGSDICSIAMPLPAQVLRGQAVLGLAGPAGAMDAQIDAYATLMRAAIARWITTGQSVPEG